jgi:hypothetical protein
MVRMADSDGLKSRFELAMERLQKEDESAGVSQHSLTDAQRAEIAETRNFYDAKLAEAEILHLGTLNTTWDPDARALLEQNYRRDRERLAAERDHKIERIRRT